MASERSSEKGQPVPGMIVQRSILQQAEAVIAGQTSNIAGPSTRESFSHVRNTGILSSDDTPDEDEDAIPPPAYGVTYGEIRNEKAGLGTSARITDDGRVNIRINQLNRRLSQILTPAIREVQSDQNNRPPPPPYIPSSLGGGVDGVAPPPHLNVVIQVVGSRGDVQPFVALGKVLKDTYGHRVRLATHPKFKGFVQENGLEFFSIGGDPSRLMAFMVKNPSLMPGFRSLLSGDVSQRRKDVAEYIQGCWRSCYKAGDGMSENDNDSENAARPFVADCIIANPPSFAHIHCAEKLGIPLHIMFTMPWSPTQAFPHPLANIQSSNADPQLTNYMSYSMIEVLSWQGLGDVINRFRAKCLALDPVSLIWAPGMLQRLKIPHTYCWSPALIPKPKDWGAPISIAGFYFLNLASNYTPSPDLQIFLDAGPPPVYIGFGSIVLDNPNAMTELIFEAAKKIGQRVLLSKGWGGMGASELRIPDNVFMLGNVPHDWLFRHVSCVVHHGGAGTTAAGITAGRPTLVVPFFGDQPFWGAMVARAGAGPDPIPHRQLTADKLAAAIRFCLRPESFECARELASKIAAERGSDTGAQSFHQFLEPDRLRCAFAPSRAAAWRIKRTKVKLSPFAACVLANAKLLDFRDLKLFRPQEYETDKGPWDPISGGFVAACGAFSDMGKGLLESPSETYKALQLPFKQSRTHSQTSGLARLTPSTSPGQSQTSLTKQESAPSIRSSGPSSAASDLKASPKERDMMRQTGAHTSKGLGRFAKSLVQSPMDVSVSLTRGTHNLPKLWGDDTVRPQAQVSGLASGVKTAGKEFGIGWYDGITGMVTQPWQGAKKDGAGGFIKGISKGMGGSLVKPLAGTLGILSYTMKGVHKEVQNLFGGNVQNYIIASRTAQGYEEWLQSSDAEKQDVIVRWKLIQKYLKTRGKREEMVRDILDAQREMTTGSDQARTSSSIAPEEKLRTPEVNQSIRISTQDMSYRDAEGSGNRNGALHENASQLQHQRQAEYHQEDQENLRQAMAASEAEAQRNARDTLAYEEQLQQVLLQSLVQERRSSSASEWESDLGLNGNNDEEFERRSGANNGTAVTRGSQNIPPASLYDPGHLAGTTQGDFEAQRQGQHREKRMQEETEEEIVLEYVRKQNLLEQHHQNKGKRRERVTEDDRELHKVLTSSMQRKKHDAGNFQNGGPSRM